MRIGSTRRDRCRRARSSARQTVENRIKRVEKIAKVGGDKAAKIEYELLLRYKDALEQGQSARTVIPQNDDEEQCAKQM